LFKIATQGISLWCFHVCLYYSWIWFIILHCFIEFLHCEITNQLLSFNISIKYSIISYNPGIQHW
jgi:hypothetical protein